MSVDREGAERPAHLRVRCPRNAFEPARSLRSRHARSAVRTHNPASRRIVRPESSARPTLTRSFTTNGNCSLANDQTILVKSSLKRKIERNGQGAHLIAGCNTIGAAAV